VIDTHTHIYLTEFEADCDLMLERARQIGVRYMLMPNIDTGSVNALRELAGKYSDCLPMMGLHPTSVKSNWKNDLVEIEKLLFDESRNYVGVGEIGLDYYWDRTFINEQQNVFRKHLEWAAQLDKPVSIHSREATDDCIKIFFDVQQQHANLRGVFHCFGGTFEQAQKIISMNAMLGIGGVVTYKKSGLGELLRHVSIEKVVLETDAPYLTPVPFRGKRNEPSYLTYVIAKLAEVYGLTTAEVEKQTDDNAKQMFRLN
jgi:TatD DNase family protein